MKRSLLIFISVGIGILCSFALIILPPDFAIDGIRYNIINSEKHTVQTSGFDNFKYEEAQIPAYVDYNDTQYAVTKFGGELRQSDIDGRIFDDFYYIVSGNNPTILYLPSTINEIADNVFFESNIKECYLHDTNISSIKYWQFGSCKKLSTISLPFGLKQIEQEAFNQCHNLTTIIGGFPDGLEYIGDDAFGSVYIDAWEHQYTKVELCALDEIILPNSLTQLGKRAFQFPKLANQIVLSSNLSIIPESAFEYCYNIKKLVIPNSVSKVEARAFITGESTVLETLTIGKNVQYLNQSAFSYKPQLKELYWLASSELASEFDPIGLNKEAKVMIPPNSKNEFMSLPLWRDHFSKFEELPPIFFQFQQDYYNLSEIGDSAELRYQVTSFIDNPDYKVEWSSDNPDGITVEDGFVKGLKQGTYTITASIYDSSYPEDAIMHASCYVGVIDKVSASVKEIHNSNEFVSLQDGLYNLQGIRLDFADTEIIPGIYILIKDNKVSKIKI